MWACWSGTMTVVAGGGCDVGVMKMTGVVVQ